jgi:hypothetical protein
MNKPAPKATFESANATNSAHEAEMVGVNLIRLVERERNVCAVLRSFSAADKVLVAWSLEFGGVFDCDFEITYIDGHKVSGRYRFSPKGSTKPALTKHIRAVALGGCSGESCSVTRGLKGYDFDFLNRYETNDWPMPETVRTAMSKAIAHGGSCGRGDSV